MANSKPWLKLWVSWCHDPDLISLSVAERGCWVMLYTLAHECSDGGRIVSEADEPLSRDMIRQVLYVTGSYDIRAFDSMVDKMMKRGYLHQDEQKAFVITNYTKEQEPTTGTGIKGTREALRERQRRYRERQAAKKREAEKKIIEIERENKRASVTVSVTDLGQTNLIETENPLFPVANRASVARQSRVSRAIEPKKEATAKGESVTDSPLPDWIDKALWDGWLEVRKKKRAEPTKKAVELAVETLTKLKTEGQNPNEVIKQSILNNWTGLFPLRKTDRVDARRPRESFNSDSRW